MSVPGIVFRGDDISRNFDKKKKRAHSFGKLTTMKKHTILFSCSFLFFFIATAQKKYLQQKGEQTLVRLLMKECGIPLEDSFFVQAKVRAIHQQFKVKKIVFVTNGTGSSHYLPGGTILINLADTARLCDVWIGELPHAEQFAIAPIRFAKLAFGDFVRTFAASFFLTAKEKEEVKKLRKAGCAPTKARLWVSYRRNYHRPGSLEYDAHILREPRIQSFVYAVLAHH